MIQPIGRPSENGRKGDMMDNKKLGNSFERELCEILFARGFWVHNLAQNQDGQPADVIAARYGRTYLIDCKVCSGRGFAMSRMEENQDSAMSLWESCGNNIGWFAMRLSQNRIYMVSHVILKKARQEASYWNEDMICEHGVPIEEWLNAA